MLRWLKKKIRGWLTSLLEDDDDFLEVQLDGQVQNLQAIDTTGLCLVVTDGSGERLVELSQAVQPKRFVRLWNKLCKHTPTWMDGTPYNPFGPFHT